MKDSKGRNLMVELPTYKFREPTLEEFNKALEIEEKRRVYHEKRDKLNAEILAFEKESDALKLLVFFDTAGYPYTSRRFIVTGHSDVI